MKHSAPFKEIANRMMASTNDSHLYIHHKAVAARVNMLGNSIESLENLARSRSPLETKQKHATRMAEAAKKLEGQIKAIENQITNTVQGTTNDLDALIDQKAGLAEDRYAPEIRQAVRQMSPRQRDAALLEAVEAGDAATVAALTSGPTLMTGLVKDQQERTRQQFRETHAGEEVKAMGDLHSLYADSATAMRVARDAAQAAVDADYLAQIEKDEEASRKAQADFDNSL